ncbi:lysis protein [Pectobacterium brasiliense]|uniref:lysis protein n=1 Tax=Pectobacterium brasiliense TaxID=180957 RepID=UPI001F379069|nr:lysis protein [Pectobacterium carotovorum]
MKAYLYAALVALLAALSFGVYYYHDAYSDTQKSLKLANDTIADMTQRQRDVAALDEKYTRELIDAQADIEKLRGDVAAGRKRLRVNVVKQATATPGVDDAAGTRLTDSAQRDYFTLRERIETITKQLTGLQQYVREQCLK